MSSDDPWQEPPVSPLPGPPITNPSPQAEAVGSAERPIESKLLQEPGFLHPSSIFFDIASHLRRFLFPAVIAVYSAASGGVFGLGIAGILFSLALLGTLFRYFTLRYRIDGADFVVTEGLIFRRVRSVPIRRIQNVDLVQNPLHRLCGVAEVRIETASGTEPEAILRVLTHAQIDQLRQALFLNEQLSHAGSVSDDPLAVGGLGTAQRPTGEVAATLAAGAADDDRSAASGSVSDSAPASGYSQRAGSANAQPGVLIHRIPIKLLVAAGLASNRGSVMIGILFGLYFQTRFSGISFTDGWWGTSERDGQAEVKSFVRDWFGYGWKQLNNDMGQVPSPNSYVTWVLAAMIFLLGLFLMLRLVSIIWYLLRFYDHRIERHGNDLRISCGLFTRVSATVPRKRVQFVSVHRPWMLRWMKLASIRIETAGGGGTENEDATATVSRRWFLPVVRETDIPRLMGELRPGIQWQEAELAWVGVSPFTISRLMRGTILLSLIVAGLGAFYWPFWGLSAGGIVFAVSSFLTFKKGRSMRYARTPWGVVYRSGWVNRKLSAAFYDRIQGVELVQSPFDRRWKMATLRVDTAAAGPAEHSIDAEYLDADFAATQFRELTIVAAHNKPVWA